MTEPDSTPTISQAQRRIDRWRAAVAETPQSAQAHMQLGSALLKVASGREAEAELRRAVELDPQCAEAWINLGGLLLARLDFEGCIDVNRRAAAARPGLLAAHYNQGIGHMYLGQAAEMVACFRRVLEIEPEHPGGTYHLAVGLLATGELESARRSLARATELGFSPRPEFLRELERQGGGHGGHATTIELEPRPEAE